MEYDPAALVVADAAAPDGTGVAATITPASAFLGLGFEPLKAVPVRVPVHGGGVVVVVPWGVVVVVVAPVVVVVVAAVVVVVTPLVVVVVEPTAVAQKLSTKFCDGFVDGMTREPPAAGSNTGLLAFDAAIVVPSGDHDGSVSPVAVPPRQFGVVLTPIETTAIPPVAALQAESWTATLVPSGDHETWSVAILLPTVLFVGPDPPEAGMV